MARLLHGRPLAQQIKEATRKRVDALRERSIEPSLLLVAAGTDAAASTYADRLVQAGEALRIRVARASLPRDTSDDKLADALESLAADPAVHGVLLLTPLPHGIDPLGLLERIPAEKDVEGLHPVNAGSLMHGRPRFVPATAEAILEILRFYEIPIAGCDAVVVGRSAVVGRPAAGLLLSNDATVTVVHRGTREASRYTRAADLVVVAIGRAGWLQPDMVRAGATVIDAGVNVTPSGITGDVAEGVGAVVGALSPVPGGIGVVTTALLLRNVVRAAEEQTGTPAP